MTRRFALALTGPLLAAAAASAGPAHAQYADPRAMPGYDDGSAPSPQYDERYGTADARDNGDPRDAAPPPPRPPRPPQGNASPDGYGSGGYADGGYGNDAPAWHQPAPYRRADQVDEGRPDDAAHRADRAYTASLNQRRWPGRNAATVAGNPNGAGYAAEHARYQAELADHARAMQDYQAEQADYADRYAHWRAQARACQAGDPYACNGPQ